MMAIARSGRRLGRRRTASVMPGWRPPAPGAARGRRAPGPAACGGSAPGRPWRGARHLGQQGVDRGEMRVPARRCASGAGGRAARRGPGCPAGHSRGWRAASRGRRSGRGIRAPPRRPPAMPAGRCRAPARRAPGPRRPAGRSLRRSWETAARGRRPSNAVTRWSGRVPSSITRPRSASQRSSRSSTFSFSQPRRPQSSRRGAVAALPSARSRQRCSSSRWFLRGSTVPRQTK